MLLTASASGSSTRSDDLARRLVRGRELLGQARDRVEEPQRVGHRPLIAARTRDRYSANVGWTPSASALATQPLVLGVARRSRPRRSA